MFIPRVQFPKAGSQLSIAFLTMGTFFLTEQSCSATCTKQKLLCYNCNKKTGPLQVQKKADLWTVTISRDTYKNVNYKITCLTFAVIATETAVGKNVYLGQW